VDTDSTLQLREMPLGSGFDSESLWCVEVFMSGDRETDAENNLGACSIEKGAGSGCL
jgi:hypothetical protein